MLVESICFVVLQDATSALSSGIICAAAFAVIPAPPQGGLSCAGTIHLQAGIQSFQHSHGCPTKPG